MKKKFLVAMVLLLSVGCFAKDAKPRDRALATKHTIKATARPFKAIEKAAKVVAVEAGEISFTAVDAALIDPLGIALQGFADGVDMLVAAPLEALPQPIETIGDGVHYVYEGIDKVGQQLAK